MGRILINRWFHFFLLLVLLTGALIFGASDQNLRKDLRNLAFDELNKAYPRVPDDEHKVIIVDIDDEALQHLGQWPWPRTTIAQIVDHLTALGVKVIAFDGVLAEPDRTSPSRLIENLSKQEQEELGGELQSLSSLRDHDEILAASIKKSGIFVAGFTHSSYVQVPKKPKYTKSILAKKEQKLVFLENAKRFKVAATFLRPLEKASAGNGSFMASPDHDGILRQTGLIFSDTKKLYPSLSLEAVRIALMGRKGRVKIGKTPLDRVKEIDTNYRVVVGDKAVPVESNGLSYVYYRPFDRASDYISAYKVYNAAFHDEIRERIANRIVFIGASAEGLKDLRNSAIQPFIPGVEIHANVTEQILGNDYLLRPPLSFLLEEIFILGAGLLTIVLAPFVNVVVLAFFSTAMIGCISMASLYAYLDYGVLIDPVFPSLSIFTLFLMATILTYIRVEAERKQVRTAFGMYVSPDVIKDLEKDPDKLKLGGELKDLTVMFTDIRSFTTISEGLTPEELIELMNAFLTEMSDIVLKSEGTIDKYMGDAMMAFWNAPLDVTEHPRKACLAALHMQGALEPINKKIEEEAQKTGKTPVLLQAGIGINTGPCAVGNMGSKQRFAYSTLGDAVNLASRLEGQTKNYGAQILIGEDTCTDVPELATLEYDLIQVKGKTQPVRVFNLCGDETYAQSEGFKAQKEQHEQMLISYREQDFSKVIELCEVLKQVEEGRYMAFYDLYIDRAKDLMDNPPAKDWDGVFVATSK